MTAFVVRRFVDRGLLVDLSATPDGTLHHPGQVDQVCRREDPALPQEQLGLPLAHHLPGRQADRGKAPALPHTGRDTSFVLGGTPAARWPSPTITPRKR